jgi:uncharacterized GH25 family protein
MRLLPIFATLVLVSSQIASAHEFWISPKSYSVGAGATVEADLRIGQNFEGGSFPYIPADFDRFEMVQGKDVVSVRSRIGDRPALNQDLPSSGLWIIVHETTDQRLTYKDRETFVNFVTHKDLAGTLEAHDARGLPEFGFVENYRRFAKSMVAVGGYEGADREVGLRTELIAESNPYDPAYSGVMAVRLLFEGQPRVDVQIEVFERAPNGQVSIGTTRTDTSGRAQISTKPGHEYLVDAVKMLPLEGDASGIQAVWYSLWASLTFSVPGNN